MKKILKLEHYETNTLKSLEPHLKQWICVLKMYCEKVVGDTPFPYRERTHVGFFAAASWMIGVPALEEWVTTKGIESDPKKGRCDLWIMTGDYHIEAKHFWGNVSKEKRQAECERIKKRIGISKDSARKLMPSIKNKLAFTFITPVLARESIADANILTAQWLEIVCSIPFDGIAWYLPERNRTETFDFPNLALGTVLLIHKPE